MSDSRNQHTLQAVKAKQTTSGLQELQNQSHILEAKAFSEARPSVPASKSKTKSAAPAQAQVTAQTKSKSQTQVSIQAKTKTLSAQSLQGNAPHAPVAKPKVFKAHADDPAETTAVATEGAGHKKSGTFSLFDDDNWSVVTKRQRAVTKPESKETDTTKSLNLKTGVLAKKRKPTLKALPRKSSMVVNAPVVVDAQVIEDKQVQAKGVEAQPQSSSREQNVTLPATQSLAHKIGQSPTSKSADVNAMEETGVEELRPEEIQHSVNLGKSKIALDAIVDDDEVVADTVLDAAAACENSLAELSEAESETNAAQAPAVTETKVVQATPVSNAVSTTVRATGTAISAPSATMGTALSTGKEREGQTTAGAQRVVVPDPSVTDAELDVKELEVLKQIKDFNAQQLAEDEENESLEDYYSAEDDLDDESDSGMHLEQAKAHTDSDFEDEDEDDENAPSSSRAVVRSAGNIASFIRIANQEPLLTPEQEKYLAERYRQYGDIEAARKLVTSHLRLVVSVAHGYAGYGLPLPDLIQEGNVGLMKAVMHFEPESGRLAAFAVHWIRAEINDYVIRNWRMVKVATTKAQRKLFFNLRQIKKHLGWFSEHERQEVANHLGVTTHDVAEMETRLAGLDIGFDQDEEDSGSDKSASVPVAPSTYLEDENSDFAQSFENVDYSTWQIKKLKDALQSLDERSRYIIKRRWLDDNKATLQELSLELKVSIERVRQIESNAMNKVKLILVNEGVSNDGESPAVPQLTVKPEAKTKALPLNKTTKSAPGSSSASSTKASAKDTAKDATKNNAKDKADSSGTTTTTGRGRRAIKATSTNAAKTQEGTTTKALPNKTKRTIRKDHALVAIKPQEAAEVTSNVVEKVELKPKLKARKIVDVE